MTHILVTGGAGFIGSNFVRRAIENKYPEIRDCTVTVLDALTYSGNINNLSPVRSSSRLRFIHGDIRDEDLLSEIMPNVNYVVHFAAETHVDRSIKNASAFVETNVLGTGRLLEAAARNNIDRFIHISTDEVYGSIESGSWDENQPLLPNSPYSASKAASDLLVRSYHKTYDLPVCITRCSNNYGPYQFPEKVIPLFVTNLIEDKEVPLYGDGTNVRDWLHVDDHCRGIYIVLTKGRSGEIYNIGGGLELSNADLSQIILEVMEKSWSMVKRVKDRPGHDKRYSVSINKISTLGYRPEVSFEQGLAETINWYKDNSSWWKPLKARAAL
ncbi:dTDP-glucose 4,6-dehydratase [Tropheryma whipplei]|uniref:dTDP-glucose 4,6-dehydratase n=1 Tax=Tropheryma whipplei (strain Twist) TaxID=203267 RepID=Q83H32_TROWT|nr:dTDP-glucose 4,6-dehydratase [Tropheryma whipplei]AAO44127.1 dTDP-glucose 4,6-dehydratase [Tropheryma whipplei str. Twist]MCO8182840.1 dTDP-glucose 4,6-dehydratase [Tropheryma whipplei]CAD66724.1 putative dehydratase [Tropheryma whipplei TW08/27]